MATALSTTAPALSVSTNEATLEVNQPTEKVAALENRIQELETQIKSITERQSKVLHERMICRRIEGKYTYADGTEVLNYNGCGIIFEISEKNLRMAKVEETCSVADEFGNFHYEPFLYLQCPNCTRKFSDPDLIHKALNARVTIQS